MSDHTPEEYAREAADMRGPGCPLQRAIDDPPDLECAAVCCACGLAEMDPGEAWQELPLAEWLCPDCAEASEEGRPITMTTAADLRNWVDGATAGWLERSDSDVDRITDAIRSMDHPAWGWNWRRFLDSLPELSRLIRAG